MDSACAASTASLSYKIKGLTGRDNLWDTFVINILK